MIFLLILGVGFMVLAVMTNTFYVGAIGAALIVFAIWRLKALAK
jgi:hypothetical protein